MSEVVAKNKRVIVLGVIAAVAVVGSAAYMLLTSSSAPVVSDKPFVSTRIVPAPKKVAVPVSYRVNETKTPTLQAFITSQLAANPKLSAKQKAALADQFASYQAFVKAQQQNNAYLASIDEMSKTLHKLSLQSQIQQQALSIAKTKAEIAKSSSDAMVSKKKLAQAAAQQHPRPQQISLTTPAFVKLQMIYKQQDAYRASLLVADNSVLVKQGDQIDIAGKKAKVVRLTADSIKLASDKEHLTLNLQKAMETI